MFPFCSPLLHVSKLLLILTLRLLKSLEIMAFIFDNHISHYQDQMNFIESKQLL
jgi:hypothetical protein